MKKHLFLVASVLFSAAVIAQSPRMVLYEEFTGETCPPCASTNPGLNALLNQPINQTRVAAIKWQVPIPTAPSKTWSLYQTNKAEIDWRYRAPAAGGYGYASLSGTSASSLGVNSAPQGRMDGQHQTAFGSSSDHPANLNNTVISNAAAVPAPFTINMAREWNNDASAIIVSVTVTASQNFNAVGSLKFRTVMIERLIQFSVQPGTNGEKDFEDVAIKSFPTIQNGTALNSNWTNGQSQSFTLTCVIPTYARKKSEIAFVGFIQDDGDRKVHQAYRLEKEGFPYDVAAQVPIVEPVCSAQMAPAVVLENKGLNAITAMTITPYTDGNAASPTMWTGNIAPGNTETVILQPFNAPSADGAHTFSYTVTALNGIDVETSNNGNAITFVVANQYNSTPVVEGFAGTFPPASWAVINPNNTNGWTKTTATGAYGLSPESMLMSFYNNTTIGEVDEVILPPVNLKGNDAPLLEFVYAYAKSSASSNDKLDILVSSDCGANWTNVFSRSGDVLKSVINPVASAFVPQAHEWRPETINLASFNSESVLVKFRSTNDHGNNLYIDDVNLRQASPTGLTKLYSDVFGATLFPNPSTGLVALSINAPVSGSARLLVTNNLGQVIQDRTVALAAGSNNLTLDLSSEAKGLYHVTLRNGSSTINTKLTITE
jgi:hypothetical protein